MSQPTRFLFDECLNKPAMVKVGEFLGVGSLFEHLIDKFSAGELDSVWIPKLAADGPWVVVTADSGSTSGKNAKLPRLCRSEKLTHVILAPSIHSLKTQEKEIALVGIWKFLQEAAAAPLGSRFRVMRAECKAAGGEGFHLIMRNETDKPDPP